MAKLLMALKFRKGRRPMSDILNVWEAALKIGLSTSTCKTVMAQIIQHLITKPSRPSVWLDPPLLQEVPLATWQLVL